MIDSKEKIINYFKSGIKESKNFKIGIEHEKFLFNKTSRILLTLLIFLFFSLALKDNIKILLFFKDFDNCFTLSGF